MVNILSSLSKNKPKSSPSEVCSSRSKFNYFILIILWSSVYFWNVQKAEAWSPFWIEFWAKVEKKDILKWYSESERNIYYKRWFGWAYKWTIEQDTKLLKRLNLEKELLNTSKSSRIVASTKISPTIKKKKKTTVIEKKETPNTPKVTKVVKPKKKVVKKKKTIQKNTIKKQVKNYKKTTPEKDNTPRENPDTDSLNPKKIIETPKEVVSTISKNDTYLSGRNQSQELNNDKEELNIKLPVFTKENNQTEAWIKTVGDSPVIDIKHTLLTNEKQAVTQVRLEHWSELTKIWATQWFALDNGMFKVSINLMERMKSLNFDWVSWSKDATLRQKQLWAEYKHWFDDDFLLQEFNTAFIYSMVDKEDFGKVWDIFQSWVDVWDIHCGFSWLTNLKLLTEFIFKITDNLRLDVRSWLEQTRNNSLYGYSWTSKFSPTLWATTIWRINDYNQIELVADFTDRLNSYKSNYVHSPFGNAFEVWGWISKSDYHKTTWIADSFSPNIFARVRCTYDEFLDVFKKWCWNFKRRIFNKPSIDKLGFRHGNAVSGTEWHDFYAWETKTKNILDTDALLTVTKVSNFSCWSNLTYSNDITCSWDAVEWAAGYTIYHNDGTTITSLNVVNNSYIYSGLSDGNHSFYVEAFNANGTSVVSDTDTVEKNTVIPTSFSFGGWTGYSNPDRKDHKYDKAISDFDNKLVWWSITSVSISGWWSIESYNLDSVTGEVTFFNLHTPNTTSATITISGTNSTWKPFTVIYTFGLPLDPL